MKNYTKYITNEHGHGHLYPPPAHILNFQPLTSISPAERPSRGFRSQPSDIEAGGRQQRGQSDDRQSSSSARGVSVIFPVPASPAPRGAPHGEPLSPTLPGASLSSASVASYAAATGVSSVPSASSISPLSTNTALPTTSPISGATALLHDRGFINRAGVSQEEIKADEDGGDGRNLDEKALAVLTARAAAVTQAAEAQIAVAEAKRAKEAADKAAKEVAILAARRDSDAESTFSDSVHLDSGFGTGTQSSTDLIDRVWKAQRGSAGAGSVAEAGTETGIGYPSFSQMRPPISRVEMSMVSSSVTSGSVSHGGSGGGGGGGEASTTDAGVDGDEMKSRGSRSSKSSDRSSSRRSSSRRKEKSGGMEGGLTRRSSSRSGSAGYDTPGGVSGTPGGYGTSTPGGYGTTGTPGEYGTPGGSAAANSNRGTPAGDRAGGSTTGGSQRRRRSRGYSRRHSEGNDLQAKASVGGSVTDSPSILATPIVSDISTTGTKKECGVV